MDRYNIDNHKLMYHPHEVSKWHKGESIAPIYVEISPTNLCNQSCSFCGIDFLKQKSHWLGAIELKKELKAMARLGVKSVMFAGEGEPLMHPDIIGMIMYAYKCGLDVALTTNGTLLDLPMARAILPYLTWLRVSINGASRETYKKVHGKDDFERVCDNIQNAKSLGLVCTIGMQFVVLPENDLELRMAANLAIDLEADYLSFKPFSQHPQMESKKYKGLKYGDFLMDSMQDIVASLPNFDIIYRKQAFEACNKGVKGTHLCYACSFWAYIDSLGNVWSCSVWIGVGAFYKGNIYRDEAKDTWKSPKVQAIPAGDCRINCRMEQVNKYLHNLTNGVRHENFI